MALTLTQRLAQHFGLKAYTLEGQHIVKEKRKINDRVLRKRTIVKETGEIIYEQTISKTTGQILSYKKFSGYQTYLSLNPFFDFRS
ncbi:hypothetical protein H8D91_00530 [archaeon]|nr:hypothetical protein [archaeon]